MLARNLLPSPNGLVNKVVTVAGMEVMHGLSNMDFHSAGPTWLHPPRLRPTLSPQYGIIPWGDRQLATWWQVDCIGALPNGKGSVVFLWEYILTLDVDLPPLHTTLLPELLPADLQDALFTTLLLPTAWSLVKNSPRSNGAMLMESASLAMSPTSWLHGGAEWASEDSVTAPARDHYLAELLPGSPEGCTSSESVSSLGSCF